MKYADVLLDHFYTPLNVGVFPENACGVGRGVVGTYENGAVIHLAIKVLNQKVAAARFKAYGNCAIIACCSYATQWLHDKTLPEVATFSSHDLVSALQLPNLKLNCALLTEDVIKLALLDYQKTVR